MRNQKGFAAMSVSLIVLVLVISFMGSAAVYFSSLYTEIARQQRSIAAHLVTDDFARIVQRARSLWQETGGSCPLATSISDGVLQVCWPRPTGTSPTVHCVPHPLGSLNPANPRLVCLQGVGFTDPAGKGGSVEVVLKTEPPLYRDLPTALKEKFYVFKENFRRGLDVLAIHLQNSVIAQTASDSAYLPALTGLPTRFGGALNCAAAGPAFDAYCKRCPGAANANLDRCVRIRVCIRPDGNCAAGSDWIIRTFGLTSRN